MVATNCSVVKQIIFLLTKMEFFRPFFICLNSDFVTRFLTISLT